MCISVVYSSFYSNRHTFNLRFQMVQPKYSTSITISNKLTYDVFYYDE